MIRTFVSNAAVIFVSVGAIALFIMWFAFVSQLTVGVFNESLFYIATYGGLVWMVVFFVGGWLKLYED